MKLLCADIGGTNARMAIVRDSTVLEIKIYPTDQVKDAIDLLKTFLKDCHETVPDYAAFAAAGVVSGEEVKGTNIPWNIDCKAIKQELGFRKCIVLNDFEAAAWGLLAVKDKRLLHIGGGQPDAFGTKAILGAGTGLGEAIVVRCSQNWKVLRSEGGHASFSPRDDTGMELLMHLRNIYGHVSFERILSGSGLAEIYEFLIRHDAKKLNDFLAVDRKKRPAYVTALARQKNRQALEAINFFFKAYGDEASNLALKCLPSGGVFLAGGVTMALLDFLQKSPFIQAFEDKGRMSGLLRSIPVFVVTEPYLGILGAAQCLMAGLHE
ncbi:MAG: glucokinase [Thermodesulfatator sp.]|nr:MAG: glucokinase [Thermodesulfatator sp.]